MIRSEISRREWFPLAAATSLLGLKAVARASDSSDQKSTSLGLVTYCCRRQRDRQLQIDPSRDLFDPRLWLEHCKTLGAGGIQLKLGEMNNESAKNFRRQVEDAGMFVEAIVSVPYEKKDLNDFRSQLKTASLVGAKVARTTIIPGRRYEYFESLEQFRHSVAKATRALELAAPEAERHRVAIAVENHKDQRSEDRVALFEHISSEYVGACVDTGNSISLLEDPVETAKALAPWAHTVHLKDQALDFYDQGFLLADTPLGQGSLDLRTIVDVLRSAKPSIRFNLELITRDALKVPVFDPKYWITFPDFQASQFAKHLGYIQNNRSKIPSPVSQLTAPEQVQREASNVSESLAFARNVLQI